MTLVEPRTVALDDWIAEANGDPFLYAFHATGTPYYKVGFSCDPVRRLRQVQSLAPQPLELIGLIPGFGSDYEAAVHRRLAAYRHRGEWFRLRDVAEELTEVVGRFVSPWEAVRFMVGFSLLNSAGDTHYGHRDGWAA